MYQIQPGILVWQIDNGSKFKKIPGIIFPGNVGDIDTLSVSINFNRK